MFNALQKLTKSLIAKKYQLLFLIHKKAAASS
jgi:hypothetical protein